MSIVRNGILGQGTPSEKCIGMHSLDLLVESRLVEGCPRKHRCNIPFAMQNIISSIVHSRKHPHTMVSK